MTYQEATEYLFTQLPMYQIKGPGAYKPGLDTAHRLDDLTGNPHRNYTTVHVAGTNGKGSTAHSLAAVFRAAGMRTGLYTSPHLVDFRERIRVNGEMISEEAVIDFVERFKDAVPELHPSFFELTTAMALEYFAREKVDIAVIEVGLGGRLDSTNIITPALSIITNISLDHQALLGDTPAAIAGEKAGIIKPGVPVVIGEADDPSVRAVFEEKAREAGAEAVFAADIPWFESVERAGSHLRYRATPYGDLLCDLTGDCQPRNMATVLAALSMFDLPSKAIKHGLANVTTTTGLTGRWMKIADKPLTIADTGHNIGGWQYLAPEIDRARGTKHIVIGFVNDKDLGPVLGEIAKISNKKMYFTCPGVERGLPAPQLAARAKDAGIEGDIYDDVATACAAARANAGGDDDFVFVGGSTFVVADLLRSLNEK